MSLWCVLMTTIHMKPSKSPIMHLVKIYFKTVEQKSRNTSSFCPSDFPLGCTAV